MCAITAYEPMNRSVVGLCSRHMNYSGQTILFFSKCIPEVRVCRDINLGNTGRKQALSTPVPAHTAINDWDNLPSCAQIIQGKCSDKSSLLETILHYVCLKQVVEMKTQRNTKCTNRIDQSTVHHMNL